MAFTLGSCLQSLTLGSRPQSLTLGSRPQSLTLGSHPRASPWGAAAEPHLGELPAEPVLELWLLHRRALLSSSGVTSCFSVTQLCLTLCDPMDCSMPDFPVLHYLLELAQTHVHQVGDAIQPSCPLSSPSAFNLSQHQILF